jgi:hypothetical protein
VTVPNDLTLTEVAPPALARASGASGFAGMMRPGWAPVARVEGGQARLEDWIAQARTGRRPIACTDAVCKVILRFGAHPRGSDAAPFETLRACKATEEEGTLLPPFDCTIVAQWDRKQAWLPAWLWVTADLTIQHDSRPLSLVANADGTVRVKRVTLEQAVAAAGEALRMLSEVVKIEGRDVVAISSKGTASRIMRGYREWGSVRVIPEVIHDDTVDLIVWITVLVSKTNTDEPSEWRPLREAEQGRYHAAVRAALAEAIGKLCTGRWRGDYEYDCSTPAELVRATPQIVPPSDLKAFVLPRLPVTLPAPLLPKRLPQPPKALRPRPPLLAK